MSLNIYIFLYFRHFAHLFGLLEQGGTFCCLVSAQIVALMRTIFIFYNWVLADQLPTNSSYNILSSVSYTQLNIIMILPPYLSPCNLDKILCAQALSHQLADILHVRKYLHEPLFTLKIERQLDRMVLVAVIRMNNNQVNSRVTTTIQIPKPPPSTSQYQPHMSTITWVTTTPYLQFTLPHHSSLIANLNITNGDDYI